MFLHYIFTQVRALFTLNLEAQHVYISTLVVVDISSATYVTSCLPSLVQFNFAINMFFSLQILGFPLLVPA
jgi:hypothetical protein